MSRICPPLSIPVTMQRSRHACGIARICAGARAPRFDRFEGQSFAELLLSEQILICLVLVKVSDSSEGDSGLGKALSDRRLPLPASAIVVGS